MRRTATSFCTLVWLALHALFNATTKFAFSKHKGDIACEGNTTRANLAVKRIGKIMIGEDGVCLSDYYLIILIDHFSLFPCHLTIAQGGHKVRNLNSR